MTWSTSEDLERPPCYRCGRAAERTARPPELSRPATAEVRWSTLPAQKRASVPDSVMQHTLLQARPRRILARHGPPPSSDSSKGTCSAISMSTSWRARDRSLLPSSTICINSSRAADVRRLSCLVSVLVVSSAVYRKTGLESRQSRSALFSTLSGSAEFAAVQPEPCFCALSVLFYLARHSA